MRDGHEAQDHDPRNATSVHPVTHPEVAVRTGNCPAKCDVKKIPPELRRPRFRMSRELPWHRRLMLRLRHDPHFLRSTLQLLFVLLCIWIGVEFHLFVTWGLSGGVEEFVARPPGVEGFLPISALISLKHWVVSGTINGVHPSGLFILLAIIATAIFLKKAFCGWLCPVGTLSESLWMLGQKLFSRNLSVPRWLDYPLRSIKYLLFAFFGWAVMTMDLPGLTSFIYSPYNKMADVKMYQFFADISSFALSTIVVLMVLSVVIKNFWCRYLCPYGALLGLASLFSPLKITRTKETCVDCQLCTRVCPANIKVHTAGRVWSDECMACLECITICPVKDTLDMKRSRRSRPVPPYVFALLIVGVFVAVTGAAMLSGHWQNDISKEEYLRRFKDVNTPLYQHNRGEVPHYGPND